MGRRVRLLLALVAAAAVAAHVAWWYLPREHPGLPDPDDVPARLLAAAPAGAALWLPYPHQNLGVLGRHVDDWRRWLAAASRLAGLAPPALPGFGPFPVPPCRELAAVSDAEGRRVTVVARVYPLVAGIARLAGLVADNPWLAGGDVPAFGGRARVRWEGTLWRVETAGAPAEADAPPLPERPVLALVHIGRPVPHLPPGTYHLRREAGVGGGDLVFASRGAPAELARQVPGAAFERAAVSFFLASGPGGPMGEDPTALVLFQGEARRGVLGLVDLPGAAVLGRPGGERFRLPIEWLPSFARGPLSRREAAGWEVTASARDPLERAVKLAPAVAGLVPPGGGGAVRLALWLWPAPAVELFGRLANALGALPLVDPDVARRFADARTVLAPLEPFAGVSLVATRRPEALRLELHRGTAER